MPPPPNAPLRYHNLLTVHWLRGGGGEPQTACSIRPKLPLLALSPAAGSGRRIPVPYGSPPLPPSSPDTHPAHPQSTVRNTAGERHADRHIACHDTGGGG